MKRFFFDKDGVFQPVFFWATLFNLVVITGIILRYAGVQLSDALILGLCANVLAWVGLYNFFKKK